MVYIFFHKDGAHNLDGYLNFTLSWFDINDYEDGTEPDNHMAKIEEFKKENNITYNLEYCR